jgi:tetratricopeptide (TPR) repeat protein
MGYRRLKKQRLALEQILAETDEKLGPRSDQSVAAATELADTLHELGEYTREIPSRTRLADDSRELFGESHLATQMALSGLANAHHGTRNYNESLDLNLRILQNVPVPASDADERLALGAKLNVATDLRLLGRSSEAIQAFDEVKEVALRDLEPTDWIRRSVERENSKFNRMARTAK